MGVCFSCDSPSTFKNVRVVHLNGYVEDYEQPVSVKQVIGYPPRHFVCTSTHLLSPCSSKSLDGDTNLQPGQVYFMLPYSVLQPDVSPVDLASLAKRLTTIAKASPSSSKISVFLKPDRSFNGRGMMSEGRSPCRVQPWKPILDTITEKPSFHKSESDFQENC